AASAERALCMHSLGRAATEPFPMGALLRMRPGSFTAQRLTVEISMREPSLNCRHQDRNRFCTVSPTLLTDLYPLGRSCETRLATFSEPRIAAAFPVQSRDAEPLLNSRLRANRFSTSLAALPMTEFIHGQD